MICARCGKDARGLILNTCAECDPEFHAAWDAAVKSAVDDETAMPEAVKTYQLLQARKARTAQRQNEKPPGD